jgi:hypothetical protein
MENTPAFDLFKFVSLRAPNTDHFDRDTINLIRDNRIQYVHSPDEVNHFQEDQDRLSASGVGQFVLNRLESYLSLTDSLDDARENNRKIADEVKTQFGVYEKYAGTHLFELTEVIKKHMVDFRKNELIAELDEILTKEFRRNGDPTSAGIRDYVEKVADNDHSFFCIDYYLLFERLYALYVSKRKYPVNLEYVIDGLRALHVLNWLKFELDERDQVNQRKLGCLLRFLQGIVELLARPFQRTSSLSHSTEAALVELSSSDRKFRSEAFRSDEKTLCAVSIITTYNADTSFRIQTKEDLVKLFNAVPCVHPVFANLLYQYKPFNRIKPVGIGDLKVVKQWLCDYEAGEIAHIENVLKGEMKERVHRRLDSNEYVLTSETERAEQSEKDLQTTSRYEMQNEVDRTIQESFDVNNRNNIVYKGTVSVDNTLTIGYSRSKDDANRGATNYAREITSQSVSRVQKRVREQSFLRRVSEVEETNKHGFNNQKSSSHVTGIYRFLDKRYKAQVFNYGKRMMFEFIIPEPGAFYLHAYEYLNRKAKLPAGEDEPKEPTRPTETVDQITEAIVDKYKEKYVIEGVTAPPADILPADSSFEIEKGNPHRGSSDLPNNGTGVQNFADSKEIAIPAGRYAEISVSGELNAWQTGGTNHGKMTVKIGATERTQNTNVQNQNNRNYINIGQQRYTPPVIYEITTSGVKYFKVRFDIKIKADNPAILAQWQQETLDKILDAYNKAYKSYLAEKASYDNKKESVEAQYAAVGSRGKNAKINEQIIKDELQKHSITIIAKQFDVDADDDELFNAMSSRQLLIGKDADGKDLKHEYPAFDIEEARKEGRIIQFLQQAFEWQNISYILYPYFWARETEWLSKVGMYDENFDDPLFGAFLRAGSTRVLVPVRPAYEMAVLHYLYTREPWNGGEAPGIYDQFYVPIHQELREQQDDLNNAEPVGEPWEYVLPTTLVYLQKDSELPVYSCSPFRQNES